MDLRRMLRHLQAVVRAQREVELPFGRYQALPDELRADGRVELHVGPDVMREIEDVVAALLSDPRYEHLGDSDADAAVWDFVCYAAVARSEDHIPEFVRTHYKDEIVTTVRFGIEYLTVVEPFDVHEVTFEPLPAEDTDEGRRLRYDTACGSTARVQVSGSDLDRMVERGREQAQHALRVLRLSLANSEMLDESQLRFRLGQWYVVADSGHGFHRHRDRPVPLDLPKPPAELIGAYTPLPIRHDEKTEIGRQAKLALGWIDAARLTIDPVHKVAFLFSALESMLGDKSSGLKAPMLVYYRTLLGQVVYGGFPNPSRLYEFYDEVRSNAVHGEEVPAFTVDEVDGLEWSIRSALAELLKFVADNPVTKRSQVRKALLATDHAQPTYDFLRARTPEVWWRKWSPWGAPAEESCFSGGLPAPTDPTENGEES